MWSYNWSLIQIHDQINEQINDQLNDQLNDQNKNDQFWSCNKRP